MELGSSDHDLRFILAVKFIVVVFFRKNADFANRIIVWLSGKCMNMGINIVKIYGKE